VIVPSQSQIAKNIIELFKGRRCISLSELLESHRRYERVVLNLVKTLVEYKALKLENDNVCSLGNFTYLVLKMVEMNIIDVEYASTCISWRDFEELVASILDEMGFITFKNLRVKCEGKRYEVDIIAIREPRMLVIDCKHWNIKRGASSKIKNVILAHLSKTRCLSKMRTFKVKYNVSKFIPVIVTLHDVGLRVWNGTFVVPIFNLVDFINNIEAYEEYLKVVD